MVAGIRVWVIAAFVWLGLVAGAAAAERAKLLGWMPYSQRIHTYSQDGVTLKFQRLSDKDDDNRIVQVTITMRGVPSYTIRFNDATQWLSYAITPMDPRHSRRDVLIVRSFGNAYYSNPVVFSLIKGRWHKIDFGNYIYIELKLVHVPEGGPNGRTMLSADDLRFYVFAPAFCCYFKPTRFLAVENGKAQDRSTDPIFASKHEDGIPYFKEGCLSLDRDRNHGCAAYVAASARLGRFNEAWETMLKHYNPETSEDLFCGSCLPDVIRPLPEMLGPFLRKHGYISQRELDSVQKKRKP